MSILAEVNKALDGINIPLETGYFSGIPPDEYIVLTPLIDTLDLFADDRPQTELGEVRISMFTKKNYITLRNQLTRALLKAGFTITERRYMGFENDTKYHHYAVDVMKEYEMEEI